MGDLGCTIHTTERALLSRARTQCKGRCEASYDARLIGKLLCGLPRHPDSKRQAGLEDLPRSLRCWSLAVAAVATAGCDVTLEALQDDQRSSTWHRDAMAKI